MASSTLNFICLDIKSDHEQKYLEELGKQFQVLFGENPSADEMGIYKWFLYILFSTAVIIVSFNLLISVVSDTYDRIKTEELAIEITSKLQMLIDTGELI